jgi:phosphinothricin acetyltransferase
MNNIDIIPAEEKHLPAIFSIYNDAILNGTATFDTEVKSNEEISQWWKKHNKKYCVYVAICDNELLGWASLSQWSDKQAYNDSSELSVYILSSCQGQNIGQMLMEKVLEQGKAEGVHTVTSRITQGNDISIHIHKKFGFEMVGVLKEVGRKFGRLLDVTMMQKIL